jgi:hypothetical protein
LGRHLTQIKPTKSVTEFGEETFWKTVTYDKDVNGSEGKL